MKEKLKKIPVLKDILHLIKKAVRYIYQFIGSLIYVIYLFLLTKGIMCDKPEYKKIKSLKNQYSGKRCFLVCTGPSLRMEDLKTLHDNNEICFSVNTIITALKDTEFRPDFYCIQDAQTFNNIKKQIFEYNIPHVLLGISNTGLKRATIDYKPFVEEKSLYTYRCNNLYRWVNINYESNDLNLRFSRDCYEQVYDGSIVAYSVIQLAKYMGFSKLYFLGADCNYNTDVNHFYGVHMSEIPKDKGLLHIKIYEEAKKIVEKDKFEIFNATRGGMLEVFPRVNFDSLFYEKEI